MELTNINDIVAFVTVVDSGNYTLAAKRLGLTRSAVGKRVVRLEERLGMRLLNRTTRSLSLTDDGHVLYARSSLILEDLKETETAMALRSEAPYGRLAISAPVTLGMRYVLPVVEQFIDTWPNVSAVVQYSDRFVDLIEDGIDIAVRTGPAREDSRIFSRTVTHQRMVTCASPSYLAKHNAPEAPSDLSQHHCCFFLDEGRPRPWTFRTGKSDTSFSGASRLIMDSGEALQRSACAGLGIAQLPDYLIRDDLALGTLVRILETFEPAPEPIRVVYPSKRHLSPKIRRFIDLLSDAWRADPPGGNSQ
ncbi:MULTISPECIES: LysR family transcriptional regulator [unclassified Xanthomonas]|uniref:LysR family transcriptional regulator n=1 Tax=unclassified Xanthomonas TaxID=2643310 RepID=UPI002882E032|nr:MULTISPECIES: LysR family transcriptional regulator [unclassified Xanthomonas]